MAAPTFVAAGSFQAAEGNIAPGMPTGHTTDDILVLCIEYSDLDTLATPSGWAHVTGSPSYDTSAGNKMAVFWKRHDGSETAPTTSGINQFAAGRMFALRGCETSGNPWDAIANAFNSTVDTTLTYPTATTTVANTLVLLMRTGYDCNNGAITNGALANITERSDDAGTTGLGWAYSVGLVTGTKATAGAIGSSTGTTTSNSRDLTFTIALKEPGGTAAPGGTATATATSNAPKPSIGANAQVIG
jgi:hypothetical protein